MRLPRLATALATALALATAPHAVMAQTVAFTGNGTLGSPMLGFTAGGFHFDFMLPQSPAPTSASSNNFSLIPATGYFTQGPVSQFLTGELTFYTASIGGGFNFGVPGSIFQFITDGPQVFSGTTAAPTFILGSGIPTLNYTATRVLNYNIASTSTTAPEPGTWALLGTGLVAVGGVAARRKRTTG